MIQAQSKAQIRTYTQNEEFHLYSLEGINGFQHLIFLLSLIILLYTAGASYFQLPLLPSVTLALKKSCPVHVPITFPQPLIELNNLFPSLGLLDLFFHFALHKSRKRFGRSKLVSKG